MTKKKTKKNIKKTTLPSIYIIPSTGKLKPSTRTICVNCKYCGYNGNNLPIGCFHPSNLEETFDSVYGYKTEFKQPMFTLNMEGYCPYFKPTFFSIIKDLLKWGRLKNAK